MRLGQSATLVNVPINLDLGLPALGLDISGTVQLKTGFEWNLAFGVSKTDGLFIDTSAANEIQFTIDASIPV